MAADPTPMIADKAMRVSTLMVEASATMHEANRYHLYRRCPSALSTPFGNQGTENERSAGGNQGHRAGADHGRPDLRHPARRHGRGCDQGGEAARRRRHPQLHGAVDRGRVGAVHDDEPQQARHRGEPEDPGRPGSGEAPARRCRRRHRELPQGHAREAGAGLRRAERAQPAPHLLRRVGLRSHRPLRRQAAASTSSRRASRAS